jgi:methyl-accepting chemotaxis protein
MLKYSVRFLQNLNWSIRYKLGLTFALVLVWFIISGLISILLLFNIQHTEEQQQNYSSFLQHLQYNELVFNSKTDLYQKAIFVTKSSAVLDNYKPSFDFTAADPDAANFEKTFSNLYSASLTHFLKLNAALQQGNFDQAAILWGQYNPDFDKVTTLITGRKAALQNSIANGANELGDTIRLSIILIGSVTIFSVLLALFLLLLLNNLFVNPINQIQLALQHVAQGELDQHIEVPNRDEVGKLAQSFDSAIEALRRVIQSLGIGQNLKTVATQLSAASHDQASFANQQVSAIAQLAAILQELGRTASQIAESATRVSEKTGLTIGQIDRVAKAGETSHFHSQQMVAVVVNTLSGVENVGSQVEVISQKMLILDDQSHAIGKVVELLNSISNTVHLLSLNAAIEAAGAGESGERFAVIAKEVRELAKRSKQATEEASQLITQVQLSSREVVDQVTAGQAQVHAVVQANSLLHQSLKELEGSAEQVGSAVVELGLLADEVNKEAEAIKQATYQQLISNQEVISTAYSVSDVAQETVSITENLAMNSSELEDMASQLNGVLSQVRLIAV